MSVNSASSPPSLPPSLVPPPAAVVSADASSPSPGSKVRWRWQDDDDCALVKIARDEAIWLAVYGTTGKRWTQISQRFAAERKLIGRHYPDGRSCQLQYEKLLERQRVLDVNPAMRSGSNEDYGELQEDLTYCVQETREQEDKTEARKEAALKKQADIDKTQAHIRAHTRKSLSRPTTPSSPSVASSSSTSSAMSIDEQSDSDQKEEGNRAKRVKPTLKLQKEGIELQRDNNKLLAEQFTKLVGIAEAQGAEIKRGNDLFERFLSR